MFVIVQGIESTDLALSDSPQRQVCSNLHSEYVSKFYFLKRLKGKYHRIDLNFLQAQAVWALHPALPHLQLGGTASQPQPAAVGVLQYHSFSFLRVL
jgi:hypothetical protein